VSRSNPGASERGPAARWVRGTASKPGRVNENQTETQADPLEHADVTKHLSEEFRAILRRLDDGDESARPEALGPAAAIVDALAAVGLLEFAYLAPGEDDEEDGPIAWFEASEAIVDKDRDSVVIAGSEVLEVFDGPITIEDPPEHEHEEGEETPEE
jgi:hypothetical protein